MHCPPAYFTGKVLLFSYSVQKSFLNVALFAQLQCLDVGFSTDSDQVNWLSQEESLWPRMKVRLSASVPEWVNHWELTFS